MNVINLDYINRWLSNFAEYEAQHYKLDESVARLGNTLEIDRLNANQVQYMNPRNTVIFEALVEMVNKYGATYGDAYTRHRIMLDLPYTDCLVHHVKLDGQHFGFVEFFENCDEFDY